MLTPIPDSVYIAFSGGCDSVAVVDFLNHSKRNIELLFFNHGTINSTNASIFCEKFANQNNLILHKGNCTIPIEKGRSKEDFWREQRYQFFDLFTDKPVITCHHLDDAVETWIMTSMIGNPRLIPVHRGNFIRPFLTTRKKEFLSYNTRRSISWCEDASNYDTSYKRNYVRHNLMPHILQHINPGIHKTIAKKYNEEKKTHN